MDEPKPSSRRAPDASTAGAKPSPAESAPVKSQRPGGTERGADALRLVALDADDLTVMSAHLQDAVCRVRDIAFVPKERRFAILLNRFDWTRTAAATGDTPGNQPETFERRRCALRFEHVHSAKATGFAQKDKKLVLSLLALRFEQTREGDPGGFLTLLFAGGGAIRLEAECIEAELTDIGTGWRTKAKPEHPEG